MTSEIGFIHVAQSEVQDSRTADVWPLVDGSIVFDSTAADVPPP